eukprot:gene22747-biopygen1204
MRNARPALNTTLPPPTSGAPVPRAHPSPTCSVRTQRPATRENAARGKKQDTRPVWGRCNSGTRLQGGKGCMSIKSASLQMPIPT